MSTLRLRTALQGYVRDTYLGNVPALNQSFAPINCSIGSSQWGVSKRAKEITISAEQNVVYPELFYDRLLKPAILERFGVAELTNDLLFFGHGSFNLAERLIHKFIAPDIMLGVGPQFNEIPSEFVAAGGTYVPIGIRPPHYAFPLAELLDSVRSSVSIVYIDNPNNPLGRMISAADMGKIAGKSVEHGVIVIVDEAYGDFVLDAESAAHLVLRYDNLVVLRSFSKCLGLAAARVGYMFMSRALAERYRPIDVPFEPALPSAMLAKATLDDRTFIERVRERSAATKSRLTPELIACGMSILPTHPATSILTLHHAERNVVEMMSEIGVSVEPGSAFRGTHSGWDDSYCRLRLPRESDVDEFVRRLKLFKT